MFKNSIIRNIISGILKEKIYKLLVVKNFKTVALLKYRLLNREHNIAFTVWIWSAFGFLQSPSCVPFPFHAFNFTPSRLNIFNIFSIFIPSSSFSVFILQRSAHLIWSLLSGTFGLPLNSPITFSDFLKVEWFSTVWFE